MAGTKNILLIHGFPLDSRMWTRQRAALEPTGYRVLTPDLPGFGQREPWLRQRCSMESFADDIHHLIETQAGGRAIVGGLSMGGYILLALLRRHRSAVQAAIFMDTHPAADSPEARQNRFNLIRAVESRGMPPVADAMIPRLLSPSAPPELRQSTAALMLSQNPRGVIGALDAMARRMDQTDLLGSLDLPVLLIVGRQDISTPPAVMAAMSDQIPGSRLVEIPQAGHLANLETPEAVNDALLEFVGNPPD